MTTVTHQVKPTVPTVEDCEEIGQLLIEALRAIRALIERLRPEVVAAPDRSPTLAEIGALYALCAEIQGVSADLQGQRTFEGHDDRLDELEEAQEMPKAEAPVAV